MKNLVITSTCHSLPKELRHNKIHFPLRLKHLEDYFLGKKLKRSKDDTKKLREKAHKKFLKEIKEVAKINPKSFGVVIPLRFYGDEPGDVNRYTPVYIDAIKILKPHAENIEIVSKRDIDTNMLEKALS